MYKGLKFNGYKELTKKADLGSFTEPKIVYIPLYNYGMTCDSVVEINDKVYVGSVVGRRVTPLEFNIHSSVSGTIIGFEDKIYSNGKIVKCVVIKNNMKEEVANKERTKEDITSYNKEEFISILKEHSIVGMGGSDFPSYIKYMVNVDTLIINAVECEPYITSDYVAALRNIDEIIEAIDAIMKINNIKESVIAIKENNTSLIKKYKSQIKNYPNIKICTTKNVYPMGYERMLIEDLFNITYNKLPSEKGIVVQNISTVYAIYNALKYNKIPTERIVTVVGNGLRKSKNIIIKIGTSMKEVIEAENNYINTPKIRFIAGGPMMGKSLESDDLIVTSNLNCVLVIKDFEEEILPCLRCGKCIVFCPVKLCPVLIKDNWRDVEALRDLHPEKCIECGLCSYVCPSKIAVRESVKEAKKILKEAKK